MKKENLVRLHRIYGVLLSISIILAGICLIVGCLTIYFTGERTYSREIVAETFSGISIPVYICLILTIIGFVWEFLSPLPNKKQKPIKAYGFILERLLEKKDVKQCDEALLLSINKERNNRKLHSSIRTLLICIFSIVFLCYGANGNNFHQSEINTSMINAMWVLIPCMVIPFGYAIFTVYHNNKSLQKEIELIKQAPALDTIKIDDSNLSAQRTDKYVNIVRYALLIIGIAVMIYGFISGGTIDVLTKAINICTECIGLG